MLGKICLTLPIDEVCRAESYREPGAKKKTNPEFQNHTNLGLKYSKLTFFINLQPIKIFL